jgi:hypothetical protein
VKARSRWLMSGRLRAFTPDPPVHILAARAVQAIPAHDDRTHAEVLALIDELLALGRRGRFVPEACIGSAANDRTADRMRALI